MAQPTEPKSSPLNVWITADQRRLIERAAAVRDMTVSDFVRDVALAEARNIPLDRSVFPLNEEQWAAFVVALDVPPADNPRLRDLMARAPAWES